MIDSQRVRTRQGRYLQVVGPQFLEIGPQHLVGIHIDHLLDAEGKEDIKKEDLVSPDNALLLRLLGEPLRPLVRHISNLEGSRVTLRSIGLGLA